MTTKNGDMPAMPITLEPGEVWSEFEDHANGLTKREMFCLHNGVADTGDDELDAIIRKGNRQKMAMHMMAHLMKCDNFVSYVDQSMCAVSASDALLAELERTK